MTQPKRLVLVLGILLLAFGLRVNALAEKAVWWDEAWTIWVSQHSFSEMNRLTAVDIHPPLQVWLFGGWMRLVGITEFALRALSAARPSCVPLASSRAFALRAAMSVSSGAAIVSLLDSSCSDMGCRAVAW